MTTESRKDYPRWKGQEQGGRQEKKEESEKKKNSKEIKTRSLQLFLGYLFSLYFPNIFQKCNVTELNIW